MNIKLGFVFITLRAARGVIVTSYKLFQELPRLLAITVVEAIEPQIVVRLAKHRVHVRVRRARSRRARGRRPRAAQHPRKEVMEHEHKSEQGAQGRERGTER